MNHNTSVIIKGTYTVAAIMHQEAEIKITEFRQRRNQLDHPGNFLVLVRGIARIFADVLFCLA